MLKWHWDRCACAVIASVLSLCSQAAPAMLWSEGPGFRSLEAQPRPIGKPGFTLMNPSVTKVWFTNSLRGDAYLTNAVAHNGAGVAIGDVDGDGWADIYLCSLQGPNRLYQNFGQWRFEEMDAGDAACAGQFSTAAVFTDVDGDGDLDLLVNGIAAGTRLFLNDGKGRWTEAKDSGLSRVASATSMALADIDGDGDLDIYCTHYIDVMHLADPTTRFALAKRGNQWEVTKINGESTRLPQWTNRFEALPDGRVRELPEVHGFYRNDGHGHFTPIQFEPGVFLDDHGTTIPPYRDWGLSVMFRDLNGDGAPDMYVCNDNASPDRIWINTGRGSFHAMDPMAVRHTSRSSMGIDFADVNRDGQVDFIVVDMLGRDHGKRMTQLVRDRPDPQTRERSEERPRFNRNTLFLGRPDGSFAEAAFMAGVAATDWSWCPIFIDVDLDGYEDLLVTTGFSFNVMDQDSHDALRRMKLSEDQRKRSRQFHPHWPTKKAVLRNRGNGTFEPIDHEWGFDETGISYGMALGDLDNDGDLDLVVNNLNDVAGLYRNNATNSRVAVRLLGLPPNTEGIGAQIRLVGESLTQSQEMICGGRYLSGDQAERVFAAEANSPKPMRLEVRWRNRDLTTISNVEPNRVYQINQARSHGPTGAPAVARTEPIFEDASLLLGHVHQENSFNDWARQPLLPRRLSRLGPGLSWYDINGDGWEDLIISAAQGGSLAVYTNDHGQRFQRTGGTPPAPGDQGAVVGWSDSQGNRFLLTAMSNYEMMPGQESQIEVYSFDKLAAPQHLSAGNASLGPMAEADVDGDGDLDVFVGGRFIPGRYPEAASSALWLNENGELRRNLKLSEPFATVGLVSGATFCDLDGDGHADLALAVEWGPIRVFRNQNGQFAEVTDVWGFKGKSGWWTSVVSGDFDGDGKMDLAVGNWGRNSIYELYQPSPLRLFYNDWNGDGNIEILEAWQKSGNWAPVRDRGQLAADFPGLPAQFATHESFGKAFVSEILGPRLQSARFVELNELESGVFLNRGSHFDWVPLPREAQLAPVFSVNVGDFDGDGIEDLFLSQNFFGSASDLSRDDAGRGLCLRGNGDGTFKALDASVTGIKVDGEQRGAGLVDFNHDGRVDLAISQNGGSTKLYINKGAKRGVRVGLNGPPGNPDAVGAQMRLLYPNGRSGPSRAVQGGSGYWSQDGAVQVLGVTSPAPTALWIRWPGRREQTVPLKDQTWDIRVNY